jgi:hypothetical protein
MEYAGTLSDKVMSGHTVGDILQVQLHHFMPEEEHQQPPTKEEDETTRLAQEAAKKQPRHYVLLDKSPLETMS